MPIDAPPAIYQGLVDRGFSPVQAAALTGNIQQESNFNPESVNSKEGANGLLQWRLDRWKALQDFASQRGTSPTDVNTQLDFIGNEMRGSEARAGSSFLSANDLPSANAALKKFIRYGDDSEGTRLKYASAFLPSEAPTQSAPARAPMAASASAPMSPPIAGPQPMQAQPQQGGMPAFAFSPQQPQGAPGGSGAPSAPGSPFRPPPNMPRPPVDLSRIQYALSQLPPEIRGSFFRTPT